MTPQELNDARFLLVVIFTAPFIGLVFGALAALFRGGGDHGR